MITSFTLCLCLSSKEKLLQCFITQLKKGEHILQLGICCCAIFQNFCNKFGLKNVKLRFIQNECLLLIPDYLYDKNHCVVQLYYNSIKAMKIHELQDLCFNVRPLTFDMEYVGEMTPEAQALYLRKSYESLKILL
ncbi:hypothetical protein Bhyg_05846 [Pseudolycoriella hygida]|uniref:Uncharacterized protein n=1 Tax=Pseudolycoriella hygida TaxID=35572 RepID=A0A9Q0MZM1_9DIPT|nr:hypothetical protein Bhyg_05846 [Pseudolycoriella hygida]